MSMKSKFCPFFENIVKLRYFAHFSKFWTFPDLAVLEASGHAEPAAQGLQMSAKLSDFGLIRELTNSLLTIKASPELQHGTNHRHPSSHRRDPRADSVRAYDFARETPHVAL